MNDGPTRAASRPIRDGLFEQNPPRLIGSACQDCNTRTFPARAFCPACGSEQVTGGVPLAPTGRLYSFTTIRQAPPGWATPYNLAYVDLDDEVRIMAQISGEPDALRIGMPIRLDLHVVGQQDGVDLIGFGFVPDEARQGEVR